MANDIPLEFKLGALLSSDALNELQRLILIELADHDHSGGANAAPITTVGLADASVTEPKIADGAITARTLSDGAIDARALADGAVTADKLSVDAVDTDAIVDSSVTQEKLSAEVRALLLRTGGGASSASQVIWRDPIYSYPNRGNVTILDGFRNPAVWDWKIPTVSINERDEPVRFSPNIDPSKVVQVVDRANATDKELGLIKKNMNDAAYEAAVSVLAVGALGGVRSPVKPASQVVSRAVMAPATRTAATPEARTMTAATTAESTANTATRTVKSVVARSMTIGTVDAQGKPVDSDAADAIVVNAGFSGKEAFVDEGAVAMDFRTLTGTSASLQTAAARAAGKTLFNLGIDEDYLAEIGANADLRAQLQKALDGDRDFFLPGNILWGGTSWLPDVLNRPQLLGTGYSLSGGRNILSVTREYTPGNSADSWVRIRFVTPYRNSAYAINVTPRSRDGLAAITANIRAKTTTYVDVNFVGLQRVGGNSNGVRFIDISKLSFDLAIYGDLGEPA